MTISGAGQISLFFYLAKQFKTNMMKEL